MLFGEPSFLLLLCNFLQQMEIRRQYRAIASPRLRDRTALHHKFLVSAALTVLVFGACV